ncbi:MAG: glycosyltransferase [Rhizobiaceae bacterium]|nr:glycosyltransferase [Rhizobiaceae bacterium]
MLDRLGIGPATRDRLRAVALANRTSFRAELLASGLVDDAALTRAMADELGIRAVTEIDPASLVVRDEDCLALLRQRAVSHPAMIAGPDGDTTIAIAPDRPGPAMLARIFRRSPYLTARFRAAAPSRLRTALLRRAAPILSKQAVHGLANAFPHLSARIVANAWQGWVVGVGCVGLPVALVLLPDLTVAVAHALFSFFFLACVSLRFAALKSASPFGLVPLRRVRPADLPAYSVLVALHKEAEIVPDLLAALGRLRWPRSKLEIKLVCEADDVATLAALRAHPMPPCFEIIEVPRDGPRTKPKALSYALPAVSGEYVVLYDAEDRPHPWQLVEAWQAFRTGPPELACVQAPLDIANGRTGPIPLMFAFEYSALFRGLLPFLAGGGLILPLGGTSNHFRGIR